jgi:hypothetical protein
LQGTKNKKNLPQNPQKQRPGKQVAIHFEVRPETLVGLISSHMKPSSRIVFCSCFFPVKD